MKKQNKIELIMRVSISKKDYFEIFLIVHCNKVLLSINFFNQQFQLFIYAYVINQKKLKAAFAMSRLQRLNSKMFNKSKSASATFTKQVKTLVPILSHKIINNSKDPSFYGAKALLKQSFSKNQSYFSNSKQRKSRKNMEQILFETKRKHSLNFVSKEINTANSKNKYLEEYCIDKFINPRDIQLRQSNNSSNHNLIINKYLTNLTEVADTNFTNNQNFDSSQLNKNINNLDTNMVKAYCNNNKLAKYKIRSQCKHYESKDNDSKKQIKFAPSQLDRLLRTQHCTIAHEQLQSTSKKQLQNPFGPIRKVKKIYNRYKTKHQQSLNHSEVNQISIEIKNNQQANHIQQQSLEFGCSAIDQNSEQNKSAFAEEQDKQLFKELDFDKCRDKQDRFERISRKKMWKKLPNDFLQTKN